MEWINVEERMPQDSTLFDDYLVRILFGENGRSYRKTVIARFSSWNGGWDIRPFEYVGFVVSHWMPLPKPPHE